MTGNRLTALHTLLAALGALELLRSLHQPWIRLAITEERALVAFVIALPVASALASFINIHLGARTGERARFAALDLAGIALFLATAFVLTERFGPSSRPLIGLFFMTLLAARLAPAIWALASGRVRSAALAFIVALVAYAPIAIWTGAASAAQGDQPHYLLAADRLVRGSFDIGPAYADDALFSRLTGGLRFGPGDLETHVARTPLGDRLVQGYGLSLLAAPGWALAGREGALLVLALVGALAAWGTWLLCRETIADSRAAGTAWALVTFLAPMSSLVGVVSPNVAGAAAIVWAYRLLFTAPVRRPLLAGLLAGSTLLLTPRDGVAVLLLAPFVLLAGASVARRFLVALGVALALACAADLVIYGVPLPYAGYGFGIDMAQRLDAMPTLSFQVWVGLPGILFDRAFGLAGSAPWVFIGLAGIGAALAGTRGPLRLLLARRPAEALAALPATGRTLVPAIAVVAGSILGLSVYRLWQGGWSPPNRYVVDVLPLWAPVVALGLMRLRGLLSSWVVRALVAVSALATVVLLAVPTLGYNLHDTSLLTDVLEDLLPLSPLSVLPSYEMPHPGALFHAWLASVPLWLLAAGLLVAGLRPDLRLPFTWSRRSAIVAFALVNAGAIALCVLAPFEVPASRVIDPAFVRSLTGKWLPFALACATVLTAALATFAADPAALFRRHALLWLAYPACAATALFGDHVSVAVVGAPFVLLVPAIAAHGMAALWAMRATASDRVLGLLLGGTVLAASLALLPYDRTFQLGQSDEPHYLLVMQSLVRDGDLELTNDYDGPYPLFYADRLPDRHIVQVGNAQRPIHDLGVPFLGLIPFALGGRTGVLVLMCLIGAAFAWRGYTFLRTLAFTKESALLAAGAAGLLHPGLTYTTQIYPDLPAALILLLAAEQLTRPLTPARAAAVSTLCGMLTWLTLRAWFIALPFGLVLLVAALRGRDLRTIAAAIVPGALVVGAYTWLQGSMYDVYLPSAGYFVIRENQTVVTYTPWIGLPGLFVDRTFGLLSHAPVWGIAAVGVVPLLRRARAQRSLALAALAVGCLVSVLYIANVRYWWSDGSPAPRYLVATLPLLLCALAAGIEGLRGGLARTVALGAVTWTVAVTLLLALRPDLRYDIAADMAPAGGPGVIWEAVALTFRANPALLFPSLVRGAPQDFALALAWLILLIALVRWGAHRSRTAY